MISLILSKDQCAKMRLAGLVPTEYVGCPGTLSTSFFQTIQVLNGIIGSRLQVGDQGIWQKGRRL